LLHWRWLYTSRFFGKLARQSHINFILNLALLIAFTIIILTGILISEEVLPFLGLEGSHNRAWESLHKTASDLVISHLVQSRQVPFAARQLFPQFKGHLADTAVLLTARR
jgi:hypothetical protein